MEINPMSYCTQSDLEKMVPVKELAELTTEEGDIPDPTTVAEIISKADAEIDSYVSIRYETPFSSIPDMIRALSMDIAIYHLYSRRSTVPPIRRTKYEDAIGFLRNVADGKSNIVGSGTYENSCKLSAKVEIDIRERVFSRSIWGNY
jgi:phage gp36-like protein